MAETINATTQDGFAYTIEVGQDVEMAGIYAPGTWTAAAPAGPGCWHAVAVCPGRDEAIAKLMQMMDDGARYEAFTA